MSDSNETRQTDWALLAVRDAAGAIFIAHGSQKMFCVFGSPGLSATVGQVGSIGYLVAIGEFFGGIGLLVGILPRFSALANIVIMIGAIATVHFKNGFFAQGGGFEYNLALIGILLPVLIAGPGRFALSNAIRFPRLNLRTSSQVTQS